MQVTLLNVALFLACVTAGALLLNWLAVLAVRLFRSAFAYSKRKVRTFWRWMLPLWRLGERIIRRVPKATVYVIGVLTLSLAAPGLFVALDDYFAHDLQWPPVIFRTSLSAAIVAVLAGTATAFLVSALRDRRVKFAGQVLETLSSKVKTDNDVERVSFEPARDRAWYETGEREYYNLKEAPESAEEWMLILPQLGETPRELYTIDNLDTQLRKLQAKVERINDGRKTGYIAKEIERNNALPAQERNINPFPEDKKLKVKWVCYVSASGRFHAYQRFETFRFDITTRQNSRYVQLLNHRNETDFDAAIDEEIARAKDRSDGQRAAADPDVIRNLGRSWVGRGCTTETVLAFMNSRSEAHAMIVRDNEFREPIGVVTAEHLAARVALEAAEKCGVHTYAFSPSDDGRLFGSGAPGLAKKQQAPTPP
jgi:hypothetical protein